jgi:nucleotide-binding universal stress UspA family protein
MFNNALVGVDGSPFGHDAVALASRLLADGGSLTLVHVHQGRLNPLHAVTPGLVDEERAASEKLLLDERQHAGVEAELISALGSSAGGTLHELAEERGADLLVVGSSHRGVLGRVMLGDDTRRALNGAPCAVAVAAKAYAEAPSPLTRVGVGYNDSPESHAALQAARSIAGQTGGTVHALEVVSIPTYAYTGLMPPTIGEGLDVVLEEAEKRMRELPDVDGRAVYGLSGEELAAFGEEVDILVVGDRKSVV